ncbi:MAG TPA: cyclic nucleotide-binding domain-containing protein [Albitalea sp.]
MHSARIEVLQQMPIFGAIREDVLQFLLDQTSSVRVARDDYFFREGDEATGMFVLESGRVAISKRWKNRDFVLRYLERGDCFGEMALMDLQPRSASVRAVEDCIAIQLLAEHLYLLSKRDVEQFALIQMNMGREVCRRLRATDELLFHAEMGHPAAAADTLYRAT